MAYVEPGLLDENPPVLDDEKALAAIPHVVAGALGGAAGATSAAVFGSSGDLGGPARGGPTTQQG
jgi:hypothetical protein